MKKKTMVKPEDKYPVVFETYRQIGSWEIGNLTFPEPAAFNGYARVRRYRVTIELIDEPIEVIQERIKKLWIECDNMHDWDAIKAAGRQYGIELTYDMKREE